MDIRLTPEDARAAGRAREFTEQVLIPLEDECEEHDGLRPRATPPAKARGPGVGLQRHQPPRDDGGQGLDLFQQMLVEEQWGHATGALWDIPWRPVDPARARDRGAEGALPAPAIRGRAPRRLRDHRGGRRLGPVDGRDDRARDGDGWVLNGEKWHVTSGDVADFFESTCTSTATRRRPRCSSSTRTSRACELVRTPKYMHTFVFEHPIFAFDDVRVGDDAVLGEVGQGFELTKDWFVEERIMIGARTVGASTRALELSLEFAKERVQFGRRSSSSRPVEFMLADMAAELMAAKSTALPGVLGGRARRRRAQGDPRAWRAP